MPLRLKLITASLLIFALVGAVCAEEKKPNVKLKGIALKHLDVTSLVADTTVTVEIENPGPAFTIKAASYRLKLNDHEAAEGHQDEAINVPAESSVTADLPLTVNLAALPGVTWRTITDGLNLNYELATEFDVPLLGMFTHKMQASFSGTLPIGDMALSLPGKLKEKIFGKP
ncbi:MAG TPA: LEA type 2 family protein [Blastocatellia bacterium]|nr:LEA type 2 family protein [Blastocatellia bacterium]